jgi:hypothetical protein
MTEVVGQTFAEWEVDYVKMDGCNSDPKAAKSLPPLSPFRPDTISCSKHGT